jgi:hypothetical protein
MLRRAALWLAPEQIPLMQKVAAAAELSIVAAGSPVRGQSSTVATALESAGADDLRGLLLGADVDLVLIAAAGSFGAEPRPNDAEALAAAASRGIKIAALEPVPATALHLASAGWTTPGQTGRPLDMLRFCPLLRLSSTFRNMTEVLESFGQVRLLSVEAWSGPHEAPLGAHAYSTVEMIVSLMGEPETIDATYVSPSLGVGVHMLSSESLRDLHGDLSASLRFADGRAASLVASDLGGRWNRQVTLLGVAGRLRIFDDGFEWIGPRGEKVDSARNPAAVRGGGQDHAVAAIADSINRLLDPSAPVPRPTDQASVLATAQAMLLSARTGQAESPATIRRMAAV